MSRDAGRAGLALTALSIAATIVTGLAGPSAMEPALPGRPGQPPWDLGLQLPPAAAIGLAAPLPWAALDWLVLARTAALAFGYLPARGITLSSGLGWLRSVVRTGVTPAALLAVAFTLVLLLWPYRPRWWPRAARRAGPDAGSTMGSRLAR
jgi:hypothetical protein